VDRRPEAHDGGSVDGTHVTQESRDRLREVGEVVLRDEPRVPCLSERRLHVAGVVGTEAAWSGASPGMGRHDEQEQVDGGACARILPRRDDEDL
jgi:hypothetical protein